MNRTVKIDYTDDLIRTGIRCFINRQMGVRRTVAIVILIGLLLALYPLSNSRSPWLDGIIAGVLIVVGILFLTVYVLIPRQRLNAFRKLPGREFTFVFTEDHLDATGPLSSTKISWDMISKLWKFNGVWLLIYSVGGFTTLPTNALDENLLAWLEEKIKRHGGQIK